MTTPTLPLDRIPPHLHGTVRAWNHSVYVSRECVAAFNDRTRRVWFETDAFLSARIELALLTRDRLWRPLVAAGLWCDAAGVWQPRDVGSP